MPIKSETEQTARHVRVSIWMLTLFVAIGAVLHEARGQPAATPDGYDRDAARLELVALRAAISRQIEARADSFTILPSRAAVSAESAAAILASFVKPTVCQALPQRGLLAVACKPLADQDPELIAVELLARYTPKYGSIAGGGGLLGFVRARGRRVLDTSQVVWIGRDTTIVFAASAERWERDYYAPSLMKGPTYRMSGYDAGGTEDGTQSAGVGQRNGVVAEFEFTSSADGHAGSARFSLNGSELESEDDRLASLGDQLASMKLGADEGPLHPALTKISAELAHHWDGRLVPPMVAQFIERYGSTH
jgi:hypothetical protein